MKDRTIVVIGASGQLGVDLVASARRAGLECEALGHERIEIADMHAVERALDALAPDVVLNTAATHGGSCYTAPDQEAFFRGNALGPWNLARWCAASGATLVHYSTDYVFGGDDRTRPYREDDPPCPVNVYGASKAAGEQLVRASCPRHYVLRVASLYGSAGCRAKGGSNFVTTILSRARRGERLEVVGDQTMSPTSTSAIADKTLELVSAGAPFGIYHMAGGGNCTWHGLACEIVRLAGLQIEVRESTSEPEPAGTLFRRPRYTALDNAALRRTGLGDLPSWQSSLAEFVSDACETPHMESDHARA